MLRSLIGSARKESILVFIESKGKGYAREIANFFDIPLTPVQAQLKNLENGGIIYGENEGKTRVYRFNPRYPFLSELRALIRKAIDFYPEEMRESLIFQRKRPRRQGKSL